MDNVTAAASMAIAGAATYGLRLSGALPWVRRVARADWMRYIPPAVLLILAVNSVADLGGMIPGPATSAASATVLALAAWRRPLLVSVVVGCAVYVLLADRLPAHW